MRTHALPRPARRSHLIDLLLWTTVLVLIAIVVSGCTTLPPYAALHIGWTTMPPAQAATPPTTNAAAR